MGKDKSQLIALLVDVTKVLEAIEVPFWIDCGSLLGAVRSGRIIPWEEDIDLGTWATEMPREKVEVFEMELSKSGVTVTPYCSHINISSGSFYVDLKLYCQEGAFAVEEKWEPVTIAGKAINSMGLS